MYAALASAIASLMGVEVSPNQLFQKLKDQFRALLLRMLRPTVPFQLN